MKFSRKARRRTAGAVVAAGVVSLLWVNGIHNVGTASTDGGDGCNVQSSSTKPHIPKLPKIPADKKQKSKDIKGQATAYTQSAAIEPIADFSQDRQKLPVTVKSADGPNQTVTDTSRILAVNQSGGLANAVIGLGLGCNLIGRDVATKIPDLMPGREELPLVTQNGHELNAEAMLNLSPSVIITDTSIGPYDAQQQLRDAGIPVVFVENSTEAGVNGVAKQVEAVADALGVSKLGKKLGKRSAAEIKKTTEEIQARIAPRKKADKPRTVFLYLRGSIYYWFGEGSGADTLIDGIGALDVAKEVGFKGMAPTNSEALVKAKPDVILVMTKGLASVGGIDEAVKLPGIAQTPAGKNKRFVDMSDYEVMSFGPRTAGVLAALSVAVHQPKYAYVPKEIPEL